MRQLFFSFFVPAAPLAVTPQAYQAALGIGLSLEKALERLPPPPHP